MSSTLEVIRHDLTDEYPWPHDVSELLGTFSRPLPKRLASDEFQSNLPFPTRELLVEALQSPAVVLEDEENDHDETIPVTDVIDAILSSVQTVRTASALGRGPEQARFSWASLITTLGITISENVYFSDDVSFLMPRTTMRSEPRDSSDLEGKAVVLLSSFIRRSSCFEPVNDAENVTSEPRSESSERPFQDSFLPLDLPLDAYVTPGCGKRVDCCLPVVCAADEDEVEFLVTSVVCQRYVLNIGIPVIGVSLSKSRTSASIVFGWSEVDPSSLDAPPIIHLALSREKGDSRTSLGLFDLDDPISAMFFGQFILGCRSQFDSVESLSKNRDTRDLCWRLDRIPLDSMLSPCSLFTGTDTFVETWSRNLPPTANAGTSIFHHLRSVLANMSNKKLVSSGRNPSTSNDHLQVPSLHRSPSSASCASQEKSYSASDFAALKAENGLAAMEPGTDTWLWERSTLRLFCIKLPSDVRSDFSKQFNEMIDLYDQLVEFRWPKEWKGDNFMSPYCDPPCQGQRAAFFKECKEFMNNPRNPTPSKLESTATASVVNHMTTFLRAVSTAQSSARQAAFSGAGESAMRSAWDELLKTACCDPMGDVSDTYFMEKSIGLPRNRAVGNISFPDVFQSRILVLLLIKQSAGVSLNQLDLWNNIVAAVQQAVKNKQRCESRPLMVQDRSNEPSTAHADGLYCFEYPVDQNAMGKRPKGTLPGWFHSFFAVFKKPSKTKCTAGKNHTFEFQEPSTKATQSMTFNDAHVNCLMCPEVTKSLPNPAPFSVENDDFLRFYFPFIYVENKRATKSLRQALHQCQMYCIFGVEFLASLGITDFPVFGVITAASEGEIIMAWKSSKSVEADYRSSYQTLSENESRHQFNILVDQGCKKFDLSSPMHAFNFFTTIHRIFKRQELLAKEVRKKHADLARIWKDPQNELQNWMMKPKVRPPRKLSPGPVPTTK